MPNLQNCMIFRLIIIQIRCVCPYYTNLISNGDSTLYGMTSWGGFYSKGIIFKINTDGSGYEDLFDFDGKTSGAHPYGSLILTGDSLYGMTSSGGINDYGVIFKISVSGTGYQKLLDFDGTNRGAVPYGSLILAGDSLFGMTFSGGINDKGVIFKINRNGKGYQKLWEILGDDSGANPYGSLTITGDSLFGMTSSGGMNNNGVVFKINTDGTGFHILFDFDGTNSGANPYGSLILTGDSLGNDKSRWRQWNGYYF